MWGCGTAAPPDFESTTLDFNSLLQKYFLVSQLALPDLIAFSVSDITIIDYVP